MARSTKTGAGKRGGGGGGGAGAKDIRAGGAFVELFTKDTALQRGLKNASKQLKSWSESMVKAGAATLGAGLGILTPIVGTLVSAIGRAEKIGDLTEVFGLSAESASKMASAFEIAGGSIEELEMSLGKLALKNSAGKPLDEFLLDTADALNKVDDASERFKQASEIFGAKFARKFIDTGGDVGGLFGNAPSITAEQIAQAKAVRMEWTRTTIVLQNATLPILNAIAPALGMVANALRDNANLIPSIAAIGAGLAAAGVSMLGFAAALKVGSMALSSLAFLISPGGLIIGGLVAATAAWFAFSKAGQESAARMKEAWGGIVAAVSSGDLQSALALTTAAMNFEWIKFNVSMEKTFGFSLDNMKQVMIAWSYFVKDTWMNVSGFIGQAIGNAGEAMGALEPGTGANLEEMRRSERDARRKAAVEESKQAAMAYSERVAKAKADLDAAMAAAKAGRAGPKMGAGVNPAGSHAGMLGSSSQGAFNIGNAGQFFGGSGSILGKQLQEQQEQNRKLDGILAAFRGIPLARL